MTASLNAAASSSHLASIRDTRDVNTDRSSRSGESFSQVLRRTSGDQKPSGSNRSREAEKRDSKSAKKDGDGNTTASAVPDGNATTVEKSALPITFLFGLPTERLQSLDQQSADSSSSTPQVEGAAGSSDRSAQAKSNVFHPAGMAAINGDTLPVVTVGPDLSDMIAPDNAALSNAATPPVTRDTSELLGVTNSGDVARTAAGALSANNLAFAMRLGSGEAAAASKAASSADATPAAVSSNSQAISGIGMPTIIQAASGSTLEENAHQHDPSAQEQNILDLSAAAAPERFDPSKVTEDNATAPAAPVPADPPAVTQAEPVRNVHMQLVSEDNRRVDVRLVDRGGELHVSVKSADTALTQNLQDHLPDLTARLETQHMQAEVWVPKAAEPASTESGNTNGSLSDPNARSYPGNSERGKDGRQQGRPDWVDALENYS